MDNNIVVQIRNVLELLKEGLKPFLISKYQKAFGDKYEAEILDATRTFKTKGDNIEALVAGLDSQGVLDLILKRKHVFHEDLGNIGIAYASELLFYRNKIAHEEFLALDDLARVADTAKRLMDVIGEIGISEQIFLIWDDLARDKYSNEENKEERSFSAHFNYRKYSDISSTIGTLTCDQYRVIEWLRGTKRASISGCAGSGKTLIAAEKAIRLSRAGLNVLILCHSPFLAQYIQRITEGCSIQVFNFYDWIASISGNKPSSTNNWIHFEEPTEDELIIALEAVSNLTSKYDGVIVDEGQDFRDTWWDVVEAALISPKQGILYIFYDDNQALLPLRSKYPVPEIPISLSKNCRNAGNIFKVIRSFHPHAPEETLSLRDKGYFKILELRKSNDVKGIENTIQGEISLLEANQWVFLTTESVPENDSILNKLAIYEKPRWDWKKSVLKYLPMHADELSKKLSDDAYPNTTDISIVCNIASASIQRVGDAKNSKMFREVLTRNPIKWHTAKWGQLNRNKNLPLRYDLILEFFSSEQWVNGIHKPEKITALAHTRKTESDRNIIPIYNVSSFKGLESDGIVLYVDSPKDDLLSLVYVGSSRAKLVLLIVVSSDILAQLPQLNNLIV